MEINSAFNAGLQGIQASQQKINETAAEIAGAAVTEVRDAQPAEPVARDVNVTEQLVELRQQELNFQASVEVVRRADQVLSEFVDKLV